MITLSDHLNVVNLIYNEYVIMKYSHVRFRSSNGAQIARVKYFGNVHVEK